MKSIRVALVLIGLLMGLWGLWLMRDFHGDQTRSAALWLVGGIIVHDGLLAPLVVVFGMVHTRLVPAYARKPATIGLILWATVTVAVANVLSGEGGKPDNDTVLNRPYLATWLVMTAVLTTIVGARIAVLRGRTSPAKEPQPDTS